MELSCPDWKAEIEFPDAIFNGIQLLFPDLDFLEVVERSRGNAMNDIISRYSLANQPKFVIGSWQNGSRTYHFPPEMMDPNVQLKFIQKLEKSREILGYTVFRTSQP
jgi:hypothetical protein